MPNCPGEDDFLKLSLSLNSQSTQKSQKRSQPMQPDTALNVTIDNNNVAQVEDNVVAQVADNIVAQVADNVVGQVADYVVPEDVPPPPALPPRPGGRPPRRQRRERSETVPPPFPWATNRRATVHTLKYLLENGIRTVSGSVECKGCKIKFEMELNLETKFSEVWRFIQRNKDNMYDRAPRVWEFPLLKTCDQCGSENSIQPYFGGTKKKAINWLFLFLGQMIGCCITKKLKYFLKHNNIHRTGAKNRIIYLTYMGICKQLVPEFSYA